MRDIYAESQSEAKEEQKDEEYHSCGEDESEVSMNDYNVYHGIRVREKCLGEEVDMDLIKG